MAIELENAELGESRCVAVWSVSIVVVVKSFIFFIRATIIMVWLLVGIVSYSLLVRLLRSVGLKLIYYVFRSTFVGFMPIWVKVSWSKYLVVLIWSI